VTLHMALRAAPSSYASLHTNRAGGTHISILPPLVSAPPLHANRGGGRNSDGHAPSHSLVASHLCVVCHPCGGAGGGTSLRVPLLRHHCGQEGWGQRQRLPPSTRPSPLSDLHAQTGEGGTPSCSHVVFIHLHHWFVLLFPHQGVKAQCLPPSRS
jgi:hypothetical protein